MQSRNSLSCVRFFNFEEENLQGSELLIYRQGPSDVEQIGQGRFHRRKRGILAPRLLWSVLPSIAETCEGHQGLLWRRADQNVRDWTGKILRFFCEVKFKEEIRCHKTTMLRLNSIDNDWLYNKFRKYGIHWNSRCEV